MSILLRKSKLSVVIAICLLSLWGCNKSPTAPQVSGIVTGTITDIDGNVYHVVTIGTQVWMAENLKTTRYNDGTGIPLVADSTAWSNLTTSGYCWYDDDSSTYGNIYGALYNGYAVSTGNLAPAGWHVPTDSEWTVLTTYLGGLSVAAAQMKETGTSHWISPNVGASNLSNFSALPGGARSDDGSFGHIGSVGSWWSSTVVDTTFFGSTDSWLRDIDNYLPSVGRAPFNSGYGLSVRCIKDN
jgi:uncharacterized protein (TIGR02145 family)